MGFFFLEDILGWVGVYYGKVAAALVERLPVGEPDPKVGAQVKGDRCTS